MTTHLLNRGDGGSSVEGVDKSIGEDISHSSRSFTNKNPKQQRKYYILNIDNSNNNGIQLASANLGPTSPAESRKSSKKEQIIFKP